MTNRANKIILDLYLLDLTTLVRRVPQVSNSISTFYHFNLLKYDWFCRRNDYFSFSFSFINNLLFGFGLLNNRQTFFSLIFINNLIYGYSCVVFVNLRKYNLCCRRNDYFSFSFIKNQRYGFGLLNNRQTFQSNALFFIFCHNYHSQSTSKKPTINLSKDKFVNSYMAGFFEGNGSIYVSKNRDRASFRLYSHLKNKPFFEHLKKMFGHGYVYKKDANGCVFHISTIDGLISMARLIYANCRTPKINQVHLLTDYLNQRYGCNFLKHDVKKTPLAEDAWLAGFTDADGHFQITCPKNEQSINKSITCSFEIKQKKKDPKTQESFEPVLTEVSNFLGCRLTGQKADYYRIHPSNKKSLAIMLKYFSKYNLYTSRRLDQQDWAKAAKLILEKKHLEKENIKYIRSLKNSMNDKRTYFNWKHLDEF